MSLSNNQFKNVYDLGKSRAVKKRTGVGTGIKVSAKDSPEMVKHENEAIATGNSWRPKQSLGNKILNYIGLRND